MSVTPPMDYCEHGYVESERCRTSGIVCRDDSQLVVVTGRKFFGTPRAVVTVREAIL